MNANYEWAALDIRIHNQAANARKAIRSKADTLRDANRAQFAFVRFFVRVKFNQTRKELIPDDVAT